MDSQFHQTRQLQRTNAQLTTRYKKYLQKTVGTLVSGTSEDGQSCDVETPLSSKVEAIYSNREQIGAQKKQLEAQLERLDTLGANLGSRVAKTRKALQEKGLVRFEGTRKVEDLVQHRAEMMDRRIRILETCMRMVEQNESVPADQGGWWR